MRAAPGEHGRFAQGTADIDRFGFMVDIARQRERRQRGADPDHRPAARAERRCQRRCRCPVEGQIDENPWPRRPRPIGSGGPGKPGQRPVIGRIAAPAGRIGFGPTGQERRCRRQHIGHAVQHRCTEMPANAANDAIGNGVRGVGGGIGGGHHRLAAGNRRHRPRRLGAGERRAQPRRRQPGDMGGEQGGRGMVAIDSGGADETEQRQPGADDLDQPVVIGKAGIGNDLAIGQRRRRELWTQPYRRCEDTGERRIGQCPYRDDIARRQPVFMPQRRQCPGSGGERCQMAKAQPEFPAGEQPCHQTRR